VKGLLRLIRAPEKKRLCQYAATARRRPTTVETQYPGSASAFQSRSPSVRRERQTNSARESPPQVGSHQPHGHSLPRVKQFTDRSVFGMEMHDERRITRGRGTERSRQSGASHAAECRSRVPRSLRGGCFRRNTSAPNKEEENTLEIALAAVAQDHHHPKKGQERPSGEKDKSKIERPAHRC